MKRYKFKVPRLSPALDVMCYAQWRTRRALEFLMATEMLERMSSLVRRPTIPKPNNMKSAALVTIFGSITMSFTFYGKK